MKESVKLKNHKLDSTLIFELFQFGIALFIFRNNSINHPFEIKLI